MKLDAEREKREKEYARQLAELQDEIAHERRFQRNEFVREERQRVLQQHRDDLARLRRKNDPTSFKKETQKHSITNKAPNGQVSGDTAVEPKSNVQQNDTASTRSEKVPSFLSTAKQDWENRKQFEGAQNDEIDELMNMVGLEEVKRKFLTIKDKVDNAVRQNIDLKAERFGCILTGNPGTGMFFSYVS